MNNKITVWFLNNFELIFALLVSAILTWLITINFQAYDHIYLSSKINDALLGVFGSLLGLLITAYAILFGLVPTIRKDLLKSGYFSRINRYFLLSILSTIILLLLSFVVNFTDDKTKIHAILGFHLFLMTFAFLLVIVLSIVLFLLFKIGQK